MCLKKIKLPNPLLPEHLWQEVPCGNKCPECLSKRAIDWATRVKHEMSESDDNIFITLTYDDEKKNEYDYAYSDFQKFLKILRKHNDSKTIKYFASHEYGGQFGRLHFHAILFNYYPSTAQANRVWHFKDSPSGYPLYRSTQLEKYWTHGFSSFSPASPQLAYYIASYALKDSSYVDDLGEFKSDKLHTSNGIGFAFFRRNKKILLAEAEFHKRSIPRYYQKKLEELYPEEFEEFARYRDQLKKSIQNPGDELARLLEHESKNKNASRNTRNYNTLKCALDPFTYDREISRRNK